MALETGTYLDDLVNTNPVGASDKKKFGDDHIRLIKEVLQNSFPSQTFPLAWAGSLTHSSNVFTITLSPAPAAYVTGMTIWFYSTAKLTGAGTVNVNGLGSKNIRKTVAAAQVATEDEDLGPGMYMMTYDGTDFHLLSAGADPVKDSFASGTVAIFYQASAPNGWTKLTDAEFNQSVIRLTHATGGGTSGGSDNFTATFGGAKTTAGHTLTIAEMPAHNHSYNHLKTSVIGAATGAAHPVTTGSSNTGSTGGGGSHDHDLQNFDLKYVICIPCQKD